MKIGITTFHFAENCGAMLQCIALKKKLESMGHRVIVIDYRPKYHIKRYSIFGNPADAAKAAYQRNKSRGIRAMHAAVRVYIGTIKANKNMLEKLSTKRRFSAYMKSHMDLSRKFTAIEQLKKHDPGCDAYISGSDQVWNPMITDGSLDMVYFLDFGSQNAKRLTYAASACDMDEIPPEAAKAIRRLDSIALRESEMKEKIESVCGKKVYITIDPTLLLSCDDYSKLKTDPGVNEPYLLVYAIPNSGINAFCGVVDRVAEAIKIKCIDISPERLPLKNCSEHRNGIDPSAFIGYIESADYIVTNSFHGTAFSVIYNKKFITVPHSARSSRITELLHKLDLDDRIITLQDIAADTLEKAIGYDKVNGLLRQMQTASERYLSEALS